MICPDVSPTANFPVLLPVISNVIVSASPSVAARGSPTLVPRGEFSGRARVVVDPPVKMGALLASVWALAGWDHGLVPSSLEAATSHPIRGFWLKPRDGGFQLGAVVAMSVPWAGPAGGILDVVVADVRTGIVRFFPLDVQGHGVLAGGNRGGGGRRWWFVHIGDRDGYGNGGTAAVSVGCFHGQGVFVDGFVVVVMVASLDLTGGFVDGESGGIGAGDCECDGV